MLKLGSEKASAEYPAASSDSMNVSRFEAGYHAPGMMRMCGLRGEGTFAMIATRGILKNYVLFVLLCPCGKESEDESEASC